MVAGRITTRLARTVVNRYQTLHNRLGYHFPISSPRLHFHSGPASSHNKVISGQLFQLHNVSLSSSTFQKFGFSSSALSKTTKKKTSENRGTTSNDAKESVSVVAFLVFGFTGIITGIYMAVNHVGGDTTHGEKQLIMEDQFRRLTPTADYLTRMGQEPWKTIVPELMKVKDNMIQASADMDNMDIIMSRTKGDAENSKKLAIQIFPTSLLDVADDLDRASSVLQESLTKIDTFTDSERNVPLLKKLLDGVEKTKKHLSKYFKKYGVEKYDPTNEEFDPNRHNAVFQVQDPTKMPNTVAVVLKAGYTVHDRILRPAEVGVTKRVD